MEYTGSKIAVYNDQNVPIECDIISMFENEETGKHYLIYTDNSQNEYGENNMYVVSYRPDLPEDKMYPVETEEEWMSIAPILQEIRDKMIENSYKQQCSEESCSPSCCSSCGSTCGE